jgi:hypothetical protein
VEVAFIPEHLQHRVPGQRSKKTGSEPAPKEPALQLELDDAGVEVAPSPPRTPDGYTLEEMELRVKRARIGLGASAGIYALGLGLAVGGAVCANNAPADEGGFISITIVPARCYGLYGTGAILGLGGLIGMIISGVRLARNKRDRNWLRRAQYGRLNRIQWDLAESRLVF